MRTHQQEQVRDSFPATATNRETNKAVVRRFVDALWNRGDFAAAEEFLASDYDGHSSTVIRGPEGAIAFVPVLRAAFPDFHFEIQDQIAEEDRVATRWTMVGTHESHFQGVPPSGNRVQMTGITIFRLAGGKLTDGWTNEDIFGLMQQIGAIPTS